ncbi:MAG: QueG-associated DUF1730 domain-containing protein [Chloroflexota bacterium]
MSQLADSTINPSSLSFAIKEQARQLGFSLCQIHPLCNASHADFFEKWLALGRAGEMNYLERHVEKRRDPRLLSDARSDVENVGFQSIIVLGVDHYQFPLSQEIYDDPSRGIIASYAWGDDYHEIIRPALYELDHFIAEKVGRESRGKCLVDTGPVLERDWAQQAGLGFTGKNCCTIHPRLGSWLLLATILIPEQLEADPLPQVLINPTANSEDVITGLPPEREYGRWAFPLKKEGAPLETEPEPTGRIGTCGRCTRCLDACPTDAFVGPFHLDPLRCISYWTIESREPIPRALRSSFGNRIFGCDICQEVCPWNQRQPQRSPLMPGLAAQAARIAPPLLDGFHPETPYWLEQDAFSQHFRRSPIKRAKRAGMLRNVCVALGNWADLAVLKPLTQALHDEHPLPRGHAAWALGQVHQKHAIESVVQILAEALLTEPEGWVQEEIRAALNRSCLSVG